MSAFIDENFTPGRVSVIIPTYNRAHLIAESIDSLLAQSYRNFEIIVVDDGSTDDTRSVIDGFQANHPHTRISYFHIENAGAPAARNEGLRHAGGEFIQYLDSDDILLPDKLEEQVAWLRGRPQTGAVYSYSRSFRDDHRNRLEARIYHDPRDRIAFMLRPLVILFHTEAALWRRSSVEKIGPWDLSVTHVDDWEYLLRYLLTGLKLDCIRRVHSRFRIHRNRITSSRMTPEDAGSAAYLCRKTYAMILSYQDGKYLSNLSERLCYIWMNLVNRGGFQKEADEIRQLLVEIEDSGSLCLVARLLTGSMKNPKLTGLSRRLALYRLWARLNRFRAFRF